MTSNVDDATLPPSALPINRHPPRRTPSPTSLSCHVKQCRALGNSPAPPGLTRYVASPHAMFVLTAVDEAHPPAFNNWRRMSTTPPPVPYHIKCPPHGPRAAVSYAPPP
ncbi:hypothetical protein B0H34DRAFT_736235 [Crassisporium funariophilum]|nr:hypothetical protein B0H34DRAFT_736235 [Crassisporium funariophilum]